MNGKNHTITKLSVLFLVFMILTCFAVLLFPTPLINQKHGINISILANIRLQEILTAAFAGAILGLSGNLMQIILANPLASPFTLGTSSAAAFGAALSLCGIIPSISFLGTSFCAIIFALGSIGFLSILVKILGMNKKNIVIGGMVINFAFTAANNLLQYFQTAEKIYEINFWTYGSLTVSTKKDLIILSTALLISIIISFIFSNDMEQICNGERQAVCSGVNVNRTRFVIMIVSTTLSAICVCIIGVIGFIGLVSPQFSKLIGIKKPKYQIFSSSIIGGILLIAADIISKSIIYPVNLPVGAITSCLGIPLLFILAFIQKGENQ